MLFVVLLAGFSGLDPLVVVVHRHRQRSLGAFLADHVFLEAAKDGARLRQVDTAPCAAVGTRLIDDFVVQLGALVADVDARSGDQLLDLLLTLAAERAFEQVSAFTRACHSSSSASALPRLLHTIPTTLSSRLAAVCQV